MQSRAQRGARWSSEKRWRRSFERATVVSRCSGGIVFFFLLLARGCSSSDAPPAGGAGAGGAGASHDAATPSADAGDSSSEEGARCDAKPDGGSAGHSREGILTNLPALRFSKMGGQLEI